MKICAKNRLKVIPYVRRSPSYTSVDCAIPEQGSGTSLEGHTSAPFGGEIAALHSSSDCASGVCVSFAEMRAVKKVNAADMDCVVEPGIS